MKKFLFVMAMAICIICAVALVGVLVAHNINYQIHTYQLEVKDFTERGITPPEPPFWYNWFIEVKENE